MSEKEPKEVAPLGATQLVEILHIDTAGSQKFYSTVGANNPQKFNCQKLLNDVFAQCCQQFGGTVASNWAGDGGHAFFPVVTKSGMSVSAAKEFISKLPLIAFQTARILDRPTEVDLARRHFRIKAHFGKVFRGVDSRFDAGSPKDFDAFLKHEKDLAPATDELFITEQLWSELGSAEKLLFKKYKESASYGELTTVLYRMNHPRTNHGRNLLQGGPEGITFSEWEFLRSHIVSQKRNFAARNSITTGLMDAVLKDHQGRLDHSAFTNLTMRALYNYLGSVYPNYKFQTVLWRVVKRGNRPHLEKSVVYPEIGPLVKREVSANDIRYQVVKAFVSCSSVVTPCVNESRNMGEWIDFDETQGDPKRGLQSTIQFPLYRNILGNGNFAQREVFGAFSVDTDKPEFFVQEEVDLWTEDFTGFLANLALAEHIRRSGT